jgi:hypothetical protein
MKLKLGKSNVLWKWFERWAVLGLLNISLGLTENHHPAILIGVIATWLSTMPIDRV